MSFHLPGVVPVAVDEPAVVGVEPLLQPRASAGTPPPPPSRRTRRVLVEHLLRRLPHDLGVVVGGLGWSRLGSERDGESQRVEGNFGGTI